MGLLNFGRKTRTRNARPYSFVRSDIGGKLRLINDKHKNGSERNR